MHQGIAGVGSGTYYVQFPIMLEYDQCASLIDSLGGRGFLDAFVSNCTDAALCTAELAQVRPGCLPRPTAGGPPHENAP